MSDDMIEYDKKKDTAYDKKAGASFRSVRGSPDNVNAIIYRYCLGDFEFNFEIKYFSEKRTLTNRKTGEPYEMRVPVLFVIPKREEKYFVEEFTKAMGREPSDDDIARFKLLVVEGITRSATNNGQFPEVFQDGKVIFESDQIAASRKTGEK